MNRTPTMPTLDDLRLLFQMAARLGTRKATRQFKRTQFKRARHAEMGRPGVKAMVANATRYGGVFV